MKYSTDNNDWLIWQLVDSAFPSGGFVHSGGLEAAWQHGEIRDRGELESFLESNLRQVVCGLIPFVVAAHDAPEELPEFDNQCDAFLSNHVANRASRLQGRAFLNSARRIFESLSETSVSAKFSHLAPIFGAVTESLAIARANAVELFAFQNLRGLIAAAVRLGIVGPLEGQRLQFELSPRVRKILSGNDLPVTEVACVSPLLEIWQGSHDRLYSRLFQS